MLRRSLRTAPGAGVFAVALAALAGALAVGIGVVSAATGQSSAEPDRGSAGSVARMATAAARYTHVNYDPLKSPADAVRQADLIVTGTLVGVVDGITVEFADPAMTGGLGPYATFVVQVDRVLSGRNAPAAGERIYAAVSTSSQTSPKELAALNPTARVVLVLEDITAWTPHPTATVKRPAAIPAGARLYSPYTDGMWLQGPRDAGMAGIHADPADLPAGWGAPRTVDEVAVGIAKAAAIR